MFKQRIKPYLLLLPSVTAAIVFVGWGTAAALLESLQDWETGEWTVVYYHELFTNPVFWDSLFLSFSTALLSTAVSVVLGLVVTRYLYHYFRKNRWKLLVWLPMLVPHLVAAYLVLLFFSDSGLLSSLLYRFGWIQEMSEYPFSVQNRQGTGIILTYIWKEVPFVILMLLPVYYQLNSNYEAVIRTLGGGSWEVFKTAEFPALAPVLTETGIILFSFTIAAFEVPYILGVTYPKMLPLLSYQWYFENDWSSRPAAMAVMMVTTFLTLLLAFLAFGLSQRRRNQMSRGK
nr:ABC transporter permease subunit [Bacillus piscicola]